jgi:hypothetical protein
LLPTNPPDDALAILATLAVKSVEVQRTASLTKLVPFADATIIDPSMLFDPELMV